MLKIGIIGAGICGVSCGVKIVEYFKSVAHVTIITEEVSPNTTGDISAGLWGPFLCGSTNEKDIKKWSKETHDFLRDLWISENAGAAGVCLVPCIRATTDPNGVNCFWNDIVFGCTKLSPQELKLLSQEHNKNYTDAVQFLTFTSEPTKLLPYLMKRFEKAGGTIINCKVDTLNTFTKETDYDVVINCTGLGAKSLVPDESMHAIRGQVNRVHAPWMYYVFLDDSDDGNYIIPNCESVILGGTHQVDDYNTTPTASDRRFILSGCKNFVPGIGHAKEIQEQVGLRPGRDSVRLEKQIIGKVTVIHNYGHGGSGVTLAWGCATDVLKLILNKTSKL